MSHPAAQDMKSHARYSPLFHFGVLPILLVNLIYSTYTLSMALRTSGANHTAEVLDNLLNFLVAFALASFAVLARRFALTVQDRVIRVEEQLRFERLFPADLRNRIPEFTRDQFVALRFASDSELPTLARAVLDQRIHDRGVIKQMVTEWRPDHFRA
jgi:hypothetical protein